MHRPLRLLTVAAAGLTLLAGCGDDDGGSTAASTPAASTPAPAPAAEPQSVAFTIDGTGKAAAFAAPADVKAGLVTFSLTNALKAPVDAQVVRVTGDQTAADVVKAIGGESGKTPDWIVGGGGVGHVPPGATGTATQVLEEGRYVVLNPDSENPVKPAEFTVAAGDGAAAELPDAPASIVAKDYSFTLTGLKAGKNTVRFENQGVELHHALLFPVAAGATEAQVKTFITSEDSKGKPPIEFEKGTGTTVIDKGVAQVTELTLAKGKYVAVCFISDRTGGPPHVAKGMVNFVDVP